MNRTDRRTASNAYKLSKVGRKTGPNSRNMGGGVRFYAFPGFQRARAKQEDSTYKLESIKAAFPNFLQISITSSGYNLWPAPAVNRVRGVSGLSGWKRHVACTLVNIDTPTFGTRCPRHFETEKRTGTSHGQAPGHRLAADEIKILSE